MLEEKKTAVNLGVGVGLGLEVLGTILVVTGKPMLALLALPVLLASVIFFAWGCWSYAAAKGYPGVLGLLGVFLGLIGLVILVLLPDKYKGGRAPVVSGLPYAQPVYGGYPGADRQPGSPPAFAYGEPPAAWTPPYAAPSQATSGADPSSWFSADPAPAVAPYDPPAKPASTVALQDATGSGGQPLGQYDAPAPKPAQEYTRAAPPTPVNHWSVRAQS